MTTTHSAPPVPMHQLPILRVDNRHPKPFLHSHLFAFGAIRISYAVNDKMGVVHLSEPVQTTEGLGSAHVSHRIEVTEGAGSTFVALVRTVNVGSQDRLDRYPASTSDRLRPGIEQKPGHYWRERNQSGVGEDEPQEDNFAPQALGQGRRVGRRQGVRRWQSVDVLRRLCVDYLLPSCGLSILSEFL